MENEPPFTLTNAKGPLTITTYDGSGQAVHPDILKFRDGFKGGLSKPYTHIMAMTPYPRGHGGYENPSVVVSNTPKHAFSADKIPAPITPKISHPERRQDFYADVDLAYHDGVFHLFYIKRYDKVPLRRRTSRNLFYWYAEDVIYGVDLLSPSVIYDVHEGLWKLWGVKRKTWKVEYYESDDGLIWRFRGYTDIPETLFSDLWDGWKERNCWHLDVQKTRLSKKYIALITYSNGSQGMGPNSLFYGESGDGLDWDVSRKPVLTPSEEGWDRNFGIYRSTFIIEDGVLKVWYSAANHPRDRWGIGYTEVKAGFDPTDVTLNVV